MSIVINVKGMRVRLQKSNAQLVVNGQRGLNEILLGNVLQPIRLISYDQWRLVRWSFHPKIHERSNIFTLFSPFFVVLFNG